MAEALLGGLLGDGAGVAKFRAQLIERTEGNPFFLEESVRHLIETGALTGERGAYRLGPGRRANTVEVPATVQALLAARIDRLPSEDKRVLQCAAVIGKDVPLPLLEAIADVSEDEVRRSVHHLQAAEFLYEQSLFPVFEYTFKHALTLDVASAPCSRDAAAPSTRAWSRRSSDGLTIRSRSAPSGWLTTHSAAASGTRPSRIPARPARVPSRAPPTARPSGTSSKPSKRSSTCPKPLRPSARASTCALICAPR
jgi:hypothetical protein